MNKEQKEFHKSRRKEFSRLMGKDSIAIIFGNTFINKSYDGDYGFKQYKNFYYLTGFIEPNAAIVLAPSGIKINIDKKEKSVNEVLYVQKKDPLAETWNGNRLGFENVTSVLGIENGKVNDELKDITGKVLENFRRVYINIAELLKLAGDMKGIVYNFLNRLNIAAAHVEIIDASYVLGKMRAVKTLFEIKQLQEACDITVKSYYETMKIIKPGKKESEVQATLDYHYKINGSEDTAYTPIVAGGENACILHYDENNKVLKNGELLLIDSGAEFNYYCADITRTFPVNGKFSKEQKLIYEIVLDANKNCIKKIKPGLKISQLRDISDKVLADGLFEAGILKNKKDIRTFSLHGVSHHIGLDTHDAVSYSKTLTSDNDTLRKGNVLTIEPGLYFPKNSKNVPKKYLGIGIRIEDTVLVTQNGVRNLTEGLVKGIEEIEKIMHNK